MNDTRRASPSLHRPRMRLLASLTTLLLVLVLPELVSLSGIAAPSRIVAVGDIHGDYDRLLGILEQAGLIDASQQWIGGTAILVQTGDFLDRGPKSRQVMDLLMALEKQAPKAGGQVVVLLGNHEVMNLMGDLRYVSPEEFSSYAAPDSEKRRQRAYREAGELAREYARLRRLSGPGFKLETEAEWMEAHPPGLVEHREAFGPTGKYGGWLRDHPVIAQVGDVVFVHGGFWTESNRQWELGPPEPRVPGEPHAVGRLQDRGRDPVDPGDDVPHQDEEGVGGEGDHRVRRVQAHHRHHEGEGSQRGDCVEDAGDGGDRPVASAPPDGDQGEAQ